MRRVYSVIFALALPFILARFCWQATRNRSYRDRWRQRLAWYAATPGINSPLWIHAVSVGEVGAAAPLIRALRDRYPFRDILVTTSTPTGFATVTRQFGETVYHAYFPYDLPSMVTRFLDRFQPCMLLLMETELWPNVIHQCHLRGIPALLVNGRMSERSARRYQWFQGLTASMLAELTTVAAQTRSDAERLGKLGVPEARLAVTGSLKFDVHLPASVFEEGASIRRDLGTNRPILMAGSTRPGEEEILLRALRLLRHQFPEILLVLAPRHPERFDTVAELVKREGWRYARRSERGAVSSGVEIFLLDTMGELLRFYAASDVAFVGGSLMPLGGHNVLEPATLGVPVLAGPHLFNFSEISEKMQRSGALRIVQDAQALAEVAGEWLADTDQRDAAGRAGREIVAHNRGATLAVLDLLTTAGLR
jgi:3-deoxy-D-manno-octulosonic-acid transferase